MNKEVKHIASIGIHLGLASLILLLLLKFVISVLSGVLFLGSLFAAIGLSVIFGVMSLIGCLIVGGVLCTIFNLRSLGRLVETFFVGIIAALGLCTLATLFPKVIVVASFVGALVPGYVIAAFVVLLAIATGELHVNKLNRTNLLPSRRLPANTGKGQITN